MAPSKWGIEDYAELMKGSYKVESPYEIPQGQAGRAFFPSRDLLAGNECKF